MNSMRVAMWLGSALAALVLIPPGRAQSIELLSVGLGGAPSNGACVGSPVVSADGQFVAFNSQATNLTSVDANGAVEDVFLIDRSTGVIELISVWQGGLQAPAPSTVGGVSNDGRYVSFLTDRLNPADNADFERNICVRDRALGVTVELSPPAVGWWEARQYFVPPVLSGDGRYVGVEYTLNELFWERPRVEVWDRTTGAVVWIREGFVNSSSPGGADQYVNSLRLEESGTFVSYRFSTPSPDGAGGYQMTTSLRRSLLSQSVDTTFATVQSPSFAYNLGLFGGGRFAIYQTSSLISGAGSQLLRKDLQTEEVVRIDETADQLPVASFSYSPVQSANSERVAFYSASGNLVLGDTNAVADGFVRDLPSMATWRWSVSASGAEPNGSVSGIAMPADGQSLVFVSSASNLTSGDVNGLADLFVRSGWGIDGSAYCATSTSTGGCAPRIAASGIASASSSSGFNVQVADVDGQRSGLIFYGASAQALPFGSTGASTLCIAAPRQRMSVVNSGGTPGSCDGVLAIDFHQWIAQHPSALLTPLSAGQPVRFQGWIRDSASVDRSLLSDAWRVTLGY